MLHWLVPPTDRLYATGPIVKVDGLPQRIRMFCEQNFGQSKLLMHYHRLATMHRNIGGNVRLANSANMKSRKIPN